MPVAAIGVLTALDAITTVSLGAVQSLIRLLDKTGACTVPIRAQATHARTDREPAAVAETKVQPVDGFANEVGDHQRVVHLGVSQYDDELLTAKSSGEIGRAFGELNENFPDRLQTGVARGVPGCIVEQLEIVRVENDQAEQRTLAQCPAPLVREKHVEPTAVRKPGQ